MKIGLLSGHTLSGLLHPKETITVETPYSDVRVERSTVGNHTVFFINRHGECATLPPHKIDYRANIDAMASCHVDYILAVATVGSLNKKIHPGDFVIPHDFIDCTKTRLYTFFDDTRIHVDMTNPYCPTLRTVLNNNGKKTLSATIHSKGVYLATEGPRLETAAEIQFFSQAADIVGMTGVPEVVLARERGICYASLCLVGNMAAGLQQELTADEIAQMVQKKEPVLTKIIKESITSLPEKKECDCTRDLAKETL